ncbi:MAG: ribonuclease III [Aphanocapsa feldmannii 277cI]|uniref:Ribonuclease III n=1 Tax=Aphanocapsa feldmannii 277cI TaxID=2507554 RepID=A0A524RVK7_9CHRO|nr:MAG: ribonuclease III [Aphanocapsa feldmannii 288cV]TGH27557.1 MAG: ribonuclease III [Aphanocapsa feldmannii 277cI]
MAAAIRGGEPSPGRLAWLGDAVWELHQRLRSCLEPSALRESHRSVVGLVKAEAQSLALARLEPCLTAQELDLVRRGRNAAGRRPSRAEPGVYGRASGFETMVGWLFLYRPERLKRLLAMLEAENTSSDAAPSA